MEWKTALTYHEIQNPIPITSPVFNQRLKEAKNLKRNLKGKKGLRDVNFSLVHEYFLKSFECVLAFKPHTPSTGKLTA